MPKKRHTEEQIIAALKQYGGGEGTADVCRKLGISQATFYMWNHIGSVAWGISIEISPYIVLLGGMRRKIGANRIEQNGTESDRDTGSSESGPVETCGRRRSF